MFSKGHQRGSLTFFVAASSSSKASTRFTAAVSISSFSAGNSTGFALSSAIFSSSSLRRFTTPENSAAETAGSLCCIWPLSIVPANSRDLACIMKKFQSISLAQSTKGKYYFCSKLTWIFAVVFGSRKDLTVFQSSLNPCPALTMNMRHK
ncbi:hypothetical protein MUK42_04029, partial [Musa troglodytarum]